MSAAAAVDLSAAMDGVCSTCAERHNPNRCNGHRRHGPLAGRQCGNVRGKGTNHVGVGNCRNHGGLTPSGLAHAAAELERARLAVVLTAPEAVARLRRIVLDDDAKAADQIAAARDLLDRAGVSRVVGMDLSGSLEMSIDDRRAKLLERANALASGEIIDAQLAETAGAG